MAATSSTALWSLDAFKARLGVTEGTKDDDYALLANAVSAFLERETGWIFVQRAVTERHDGTGRSRLRLRHWPVSTVTSLTIVRSLGEAAEAIASTAYTTDLDTGRIQLHEDVFTEGFDNVTVVYTPGFGAQDGATLPADLVDAGLDVARLVRQERESGALPAQTMSFGGTSIVMRNDWPRMLRETIKGWRKPRF